MATKKELLEKHTKASLLGLAENAGLAGLNARMKKDELVEKIAKSPKVKKAALE